MKINFLTILLSITTTCFAQQKMVAITIDDLPFVRIGSFNDKALTTFTVNLLHELEKQQAPAIGFVNMDKTYRNGQLDSTHFNLLRLWLNKGFDLGNHTFSHPDYNYVTYNQFVDDIEKNEPLLEHLMKEYNSELVYFRHPYLHRGNSKAKADSLAAYLVNHNYIEAPVTIDNAEWIFAAAYDSILKTKDETLRKMVGSEYISYMELKLKYYEKQSENLFGQNMRHILLIHANSLNSDYMGELLQMFVKNEYKFIDLETALQDELYTTEDRYYKKGGISWLDRWAITLGKTKDFFQGEPACPADIMKLASVSSE